MAKLPGSPTVDAIYEMYEGQSRTRRSYLGMSKIGHECRRALWYDFRWATHGFIEGRVLRLFETGHREEERIKQNLRDIGCRIEGEQFAVSLCDGAIQGHIDGAILGLKESPETWHLLEIKTMNRKNFDKWQRDGVQKSHPTYYAQMQLYCMLGEFERWAFVVQCKDDDRIDIERGKPDLKFAGSLVGVAETIVKSDSPPERISKDPMFWQCRFCEHKQTCHGRKVPEVNCRTCAHWTYNQCAHGHPIGSGEACGQHIFLPPLLHWLKVIDASPDWVEYEGFYNCSDVGFPGGDKPHNSSKEMAEL